MAAIFRLSFSLLSQSSCAMQYMQPASSLLFASECLLPPYCPQLGTEYHKRFDPIYSDARSRISSFGAFNHFSSYMAQPKQQLDTFRCLGGGGCPWGAAVDEDAAGGQ